MPEYIYYTGIGANKTGKHTIDEFLDIMNKKYHIECSKNITSKEYKPCIISHTMRTDFYKKIANNKSYKRTNKMEKKYKTLKNRCERRREKFKQRPCNTEEYITFSGAEKI